MPRKSKTTPRSRAKAKKPKVPKREVESQAPMEESLESKLGGCPRALAAILKASEAGTQHGLESPEFKAAGKVARALLKTAKSREDNSTASTLNLTLQDPREPDAERARQEIHLDLLTSGLYSKLICDAGNIGCNTQYGTKDEFQATPLLYAQDVLRRMKPRDDLEAMLISQALWTHARIAHLNSCLIAETTVELVKNLNEAIDRAQNTYRRQMTALAEYRRPPKSAGTYNRIQQANIATQQVVNNSLPKPPPPPAISKEKATNELGCTNETSQYEFRTQVSVEHGGPQVAGGSNSPQSPVGGLDGPD